MTSIILAFPHRAFQQVEKYFLECHEGLLPTLYHLKRLLASIYSAEKSVPMFNSINRSGTNVLIRGFTLHLRAVK